MKRIIPLLFAALLLLWGCSSESATGSGTPFVFYYPALSPSTQGTFVAYTEYYSEGLPEPEALLQQFLQHAPPEQAAEPIPPSWRLKDSQWLEDGTLQLQFFGSAASPIQESTATACLTKTFTQLESVQRIQCFAPGRSEAIVLSQDDLLWEDTGMLPQKDQIVLYFPDEELRYLLRETKTVEAMEASKKHDYIMEQLLSAPDTEGKRSCIPPGTRLLDAHVSNGLCTVDLSAEFSENMPADFATEWLAVYSIVNTMTELEEIHSVEILVEHRPLERLSLLELGESIRRNDSVLYHDGDFMDATIYPGVSSRKLLVPLPCLIPLEESLSQEEQLIQALLSFEGRHGIETSIPTGTKLYTVQTIDGTCIVDLTEEFLVNSPDEHSEEMAVYSIVATLGKLPGIQSVEILVEGIPPAFQNETLPDIHTVDDAWFSQ